MQKEIETDLFPRQKHTAIMAKCSEKMRSMVFKLAEYEHRVADMNTTLASLAKQTTEGEFCWAAKNELGILW